MGPITTALRELMAAGITGDALVNAIDRIESAEFPQTFVDESAERRRAKDRERKRRLRGNLRKSAESAECPDLTLSFLREDSKKERNSRGSSLSAEWKPNPSHYDLGLERGLSATQVDSHAEDMRLWAQANANRQIARKANWDLTFTAWLRRAAPVKSGEEPKPPSPEELELFAKDAERWASPEGQAQYAIIEVARIKANGYDW